MAKTKVLQGAKAASLFQSQPEAPVPEVKPEPEYKTKSERIAEIQESGKRMLKWFEDLKELPKEPVQVNHYTRIVDLKKYLETQRATLEANMKDPFNRVFINAYYRLYNLKQFIQKVK